MRTGGLRLIWSYPEMTETPPARVPAVELEAPLCESEDLGQSSPPRPLPTRAYSNCSGCGQLSTSSCKRGESRRDHMARGLLCLHVRHASGTHSSTKECGEGTSQMPRHSASKPPPRDVYIISQREKKNHSIPQSILKYLFYFLGRKSLRKAHLLF
jgi:hypothetical protein